MELRYNPKQHQEVGAAVPTRELLQIALETQVPDHLKYCTQSHFGLSSVFPPNLFYFLPFEIYQLLGFKCSTTSGFSLSLLEFSYTQSVLSPY